MVKTSWLKRLRKTFPDITFAESDRFRWSPRDETVYVGPLEDRSDLITLLHETGHALAGHTDYDQDIQLLKLEREAWELAQTELAPLFRLTISSEIVEAALDSYRDWLHARAHCPTCQNTGVQRDENHYRCLLCAATWRVNDARACQLKRYITK